MIFFAVVPVEVDFICTSRPTEAPASLRASTSKPALREVFWPTDTSMTVCVVVSTVCDPSEPSVTYQPLKWVMAGATSALLTKAWRLPRSVAVQAPPSSAWPAATPGDGVPAAAGAAAKPRAAVVETAAAVRARRPLRKRLVGVVCGIVRFPLGVVLGQVTRVRARVRSGGRPVRW